MQISEHAKLGAEGLHGDGSQASGSRKEACLRLYRANRAQVLCVVIVIVLFIRLYLGHEYDAGQIVSAPVNNDSVQQNHTLGICMTPACIHASSDILHNLSPNYQAIDPCTDFEELACGGWREQHDLHPDQKAGLGNTRKQESVQRLLKQILEAQYPKNSSHSHFSPAQLKDPESFVDEENFQKLHAAYHACMDERTVIRHGVTPLTDALDETNDIFRQTTGDASGLSRALLHLAKLNINPLIAADIGVDDKNHDTTIVVVSAPGLPGLLPRQHYDDPLMLAGYKNVVAQVIQGLNQQIIFQTQGYDALIEFEKKLVVASQVDENGAQDTKYKNPTAFANIDTIIPQIHLSRIIQGLAPDQAQVHRVILNSPEYMEKLATILNETPLEIVHMYLIWQQILKFAFLVEADAVAPLKQFHNEIRGKSPYFIEERWRGCVRHVDTSLSWISSRFVAEKIFSDQAKAFGDQIVSDVRDQLIIKLKAAVWLKDDIATSAVQKLRNAIQKVGYPDKSPNITDPYSLRRYYHDIEISSYSYFGNMVSIIRSYVKSKWSGLGRPVDRNEWPVTVSTASGYYNLHSNEIVMPAGVTAFETFGADIPWYLSYGGFGVMAAYEFSHVFDDNSQLYDLTSGQDKPQPADEAVTDFQRRAYCFAKQYNEFTARDAYGNILHFDGVRMLRGTIADASSLSVAFNAWKLRSMEKTDQDLPGLGFFSHDQLFFVRYANLLCSQGRRRSSIDPAKPDPFVANWVRVIGGLANSREFKEAFQCPTREPVCEMW